jgi:hypothetical protein
MPTVLLTLLTAHTRAFLRRMLSSISTARLMSTVVLLLVLAWSGQTIASVLFRDPYDPAVFRLWVAVLLFAWTLWHCVRVAWKRPESAIEWSEEEEYLIVAGPFTARQRLAYRVTMVLTATLPKALLTMLVLCPDLSWYSPAGILLALVGLEVFRMLLDIGVSCLNERGYWCYRVAVGIALITFVMLGHTQVTQLADQSAAPGLTLHSFTATQLVEAVSENKVIAAVATPFFWISDGIAAHSNITLVAIRLAGMSLGLLLMLWLMEALEHSWRRLSVQRERAGWQPSHMPATSATAAAPADSHGLPPVLFGQPLFWRQWRRALRYYGSVIVALAVPVILLSPLMTLPDPSIAFTLVFCGALFYTFVLLPEAIKFDFRLDYDHMYQLKLLPLTPTRIVLGQLTTPVILCCLFQAGVFIGVGLMRSIDPPTVIAAVAVSIPLTILFVALDNLAFLLSPHRPTQEGFEAFLRTILKFTAKSLLMLGFLLLLAVWAPIAAAIANVTASSTTSVFGIGTVVGIAILAAVSVACVVTAFRRFDVSLHGAS